MVVTDGFVGNVVLKHSEGLARALTEAIRDEVSAGSLFVKLGAALMLPAMRRVKKNIAYETYGGAPLLGLRGTCIVAHGRANREAIYNAVRTAAAAYREDVVGRIAALIAP